MKKQLLTVICIGVAASLIPAGSSYAEEATQSLPLFAHQDTLLVQIEGPLSTMARERSNQLAFRSLATATRRRGSLE